MCERACGDDLATEVGADEIEAGEGVGEGGLRAEEVVEAGGDGGFGLVQVGESL